MTDENDHKRAVRAVWDAVRQDRRARRKQLSQAELNESAALLRAHGDALSALATRAPATAAEVEGASGTAKPAAKPKRKKTAKRGSARGAKKTKKT